MTSSRHSKASSRLGLHLACLLTRGQYIVLASAVECSICSLAPPVPASAHELQCFRSSMPRLLGSGPCSSSVRLAWWALATCSSLLRRRAGDNTVLLQQVAALLLKKYKEKFDGGAVHASWVYLRQWAVGAMPANPLTSYDTSSRHLRDPTFLKRALRCAFICHCEHVMQPGQAAAFGTRKMHFCRPT